MRYATPEAFRAALEDRLENAQNETVGVSRLRKRVVFERLLARLTVQAAGEWVLKGGFALELRLDKLSRSTKDMDVDWSLGEEDATERLLDAADLDVGDMFEFRLQRADPGEEIDGGGRRWRATALLDGREFERILLDVTFAAEPIFEPDTVMSFGLLAFAGLNRVQVRTLAIEQHLAEKVHAYTRTYAGDRPSSRVKDLIDIDVIAATTRIDSDRLRVALDTLFAERDTHHVPSKLPPPPENWARTWSKLAANLPIPATLTPGHQRAARFLDPILAGMTTNHKWEPEAGWHRRCVSTAESHARRRS
jgi:predicted nucleotidyltransferase component of viral defense system